MEPKVVSKLHELLKENFRILTADQQDFYNMVVPVYG